MLIKIHDGYYRDSPESVQMSAFISEREYCRFSCTVAFKAGHAPEKSGDRSRPPQTLIFSGNGKSLDFILQTPLDDSILEHRERLLTLFEKEVTVQSTSKRWKVLHVEVTEVSRQALEVNFLLEDSKEVMTANIPIGIFYDMRKALSNIKGKRGSSGLVLSWVCPNYGHSLAVVSQELD